MRDAILAALSAEEIETLIRYATANGKCWKAKLRDAWMSAAEPGILQQLRNASYFGPNGLDKIKLKIGGVNVKVGGSYHCPHCCREFENVAPGEVLYPCPSGDCPLHDDVGKPAFSPAAPVKTYRELKVALDRFSNEQLDQPIIVEDATHASVICPPAFRPAELAMRFAEGKPKLLTKPVLALTR